MGLVCTQSSDKTENKLVVVTYKVAAVDCESVYAVFLQLVVKLLLLSMDCTCRSNASKVLRDSCGVTLGILSRSRERERRFVTKRSECAGSCRREMALAIVLEAVRIYRAVTKKVIRSR